MGAHKDDNRRSRWIKMLKVTGIILVAGLLCVGVLIFCVVGFVDSRYLAPMVERLANDYIDGDVKVGEINLGFRAKFPILSVDVDNLCVISHAFDSLSTEQKGLLPEYADSLLALDHFSGALDIKRLIVNGELSLHDVSLQGLSANLVIAHDGKANYDIIKLPVDTMDRSKAKLPGFRINRLSLESPRAMRFFNATDSTSASVLLLTDASVDGGSEPTYRLKVSGNVTSSRATLITNLENISFGLNGKVYYDPVSPGIVAMDEMEVQWAFARAIVSGEIDLTSSPIVKRGKVELQPVPVTDLLTVLPDTIRSRYNLREPYFLTDACVGATVELTRPMNLVTDTLPTAKIDLSIAPSTLDYGDSHITDLALDVAVNTVTNLPDSIMVDLKHFSLIAPGTNLEAEGQISTLVSDPSFDIGIEGSLDLRDLPEIVREEIPGYLSGKIATDLRARGSLSMIKPGGLHSLEASGRVEMRDLYYLTQDTAKLIEIGPAIIDLKSEKESVGSKRLQAIVKIDTASILVSGVNLSLSKIALKATTGGNGDHNSRGSELIPPIGGYLRVGRFNVTSITDSAGAKMSDIAGPVRVRSRKGAPGLPDIVTDLMVGKVSAGTMTDRVVLDSVAVKAGLSKMATAKHNTAKDVPSGRARREPRKAPGYLSPEAVYRYVYNKRKHGKHTKRVYDAADTDNDEILVWNLTPQFRRFLNDWELTGSVATTRSRLLTPLFPLSNRISRVDLSFNNDTIDISDISLKVGSTDMTISGLITNVKQALTSDTHDNLKINLALMSNTIDVNELSAAIFTGASYNAKRRKGVDTPRLRAVDDKTLEERLEALSKAGPGHDAPVLIPVNVDGKVEIAASRVVYGDLNVRNLEGEVLVYDGGVNLHNLNASSDAGNLNISALYSAPRPTAMNFGFGMELSDFDIAKFVKLVPAIDSITPLMHDFSGMVGVDLAATCRIDSGMNIVLPSLNAAVKIQGDNLAFIDHDKYRTLAKWLGFRNKTDTTLHSLNVEMTISDGLLRVYPFTFSIDRYRLGVYGSNDLAMNFNYHISVLKSPIPFKFGINLSGSPRKYKVRFGGAKFKENSVVESREIVNHARINLLDQIEGVFSRGVRNSSFANLRIDTQGVADDMEMEPLTPSDSLKLIQEGLIDEPETLPPGVTPTAPGRHKAPKRRPGFLRFFSR